MAYNPFTLEGKTILVTGASSGIGRATAIECSKMGASVIITGRNEERLNETFKALEGEGHQQIVADLTNQEDIDNLVSLFLKILADLLLHLYCRMVVSDRDLHTLSFPQTPVCRTLFCLIQLCFRCSGLFRSMSVKSEHHFFSGL